MRLLMLATLLGAFACGDSAAPPVTDASVDAPSDTPAADPCALCTQNEICVQRFDGVCGIFFHGCVTRTVDCPQNACSDECEQAYCADAFQCMYRPPCGTEAQGAFTCYGP